MDSDVDGEIDAMPDGYRNMDFTPASFAEADNKNIHPTQFVMKTADINIASNDVVQVVHRPLTFWRRFLNLFSFLKND
jgi:hypothetical protein